MPPELDTLLDRFEGHAAPDSIEAQRVRVAVRARLLEQSVPETRIDRYVVREQLGQGGMGVVYAAHDAELDRVVAIKLVRGAAGADRSADQQRLLREARALAQLSHPNVVAIYDVGLHRDRVFIAMELVRGKTLRAHQVAGVTPWPAIVSSYRQAGEGLAAAHAVGLVHRDFKPDNALVGDDGRVRVLDFGLAQTNGLVVSEEGSSFSTAVSPVLTATGKVVGTPAYMSPEQFAGAPADARSDQFSFCVAFWEALFGERPFAGGTAEELRMAVVLDRISTPAHPERAPRWLRAVLQRGLAHDPERRWPSLRELLDACGAPPRSWRRSKLALGVVAVAGVTAFGVHAGVTAQRERSCAAAGADIQQVWNEETAGAVASAFEATGIPHVRTSAAMLEQRLTTWRDAWGAATERSCLAHRVDRTLDLTAWARRDACLQEHRERLGTTVEVLLEPDREDVDNALRVAYDLPDNGECENDGQLAAQAAALGPGVTIAAVTQLRRQLARAEQLAQSGRSTEARELAAAAEQQALALGDPALQAETLLVMSIADRGLGEFRAAADEAQRAFFLATQIGADETALRAATDLVSIHGVRLAEFDEAMTWSRHAEGVLLRIGPQHDWYAAELQEHVGSVLRLQGDFAAAQAAYERGIELRTATAGPDHPAVANGLLNIGAMLAELGRAEATTYLDRAEVLFSESYGETKLAAIDATRCAYEMKRGNYEAAPPLCERALARRELELGPDHPQVAVALNNLASVRMTSGDFATARELLQRSAEIRRTRLGPLHPALAATLNNLGLLEYHLDDYAAAEKHLSEAIEIRRVALPPGHVDMAVSLTNLADVHGIQKHYARAKVLLDEAIQITADEPMEAGAHGLALVARGKVQLLDGRREPGIADLEAALLTPVVTDGDPATRCELRQLLADALQSEPGARERVRALARAALPDCVAAGDRATAEAEQMRELAR